VKWIVSLVAACLISVPLRPQDLSPTTNARANSQASSELILSERLAREYEKQAGLGCTLELARISRYLGSVGRHVASVLPSHLQYHFVYDPNPDFKSASALPGGYIILGGGLLALTQTEDELGNSCCFQCDRKYSTGFSSGHSLAGTPPTTVHSAGR
jgi:predicted Zn-dependent protease